MIIYKVTNKLNGKIYIGQTIQSLKRRFANHACQGHCLYSAIKKYSKENFKIQLLARCNSREEMNHRESYYIKLFNTLAPNGYNLTSGGPLGASHVYTKRKLSVSHRGIALGRKHSEETKKKIALGNTGKKFSPERTSNISKSLKGKISPLRGRKHTEETKQKMSAIHRGQIAWNKGIKTGIPAAHCKQVVCLENNQIYGSVTLAAIAMNCSRASIIFVCNGKRKSIKGKHFAFVTKESNYGNNSHHFS